jgi:hypothetical protein
MCYTGLWIHWFRDPGATIPNGSVTIGQTSLVGMGYSKSDSIMPLMFRMVCCAMTVVTTQGKAPATFALSSQKD